LACSAGRSCHVVVVLDGAFKPTDFDVCEASQFQEFERLLLFRGSFEHQE
jgi:hypothetical protein